jgi:hypothetical protein
MDAALKIVTHLPLRELWRDDGLKTTARIRSLTEDDIRSLLRSGNIQFVVVNVGASPCWIQPNECPFSRSAPVKFRKRIYCTAVFTAAVSRPKPKVGACTAKF